MFAVAADKCDAAQRGSGQEWQCIAAAVDLARYPHAVVDGPDLQARVWGDIAGKRDRRSLLADDHRSLPVAAVDPVLDPVDPVKGDVVLRPGTVLVG